jgi:hypothetical protein
MAKAVSLTFNIENKTLVDDFEMEEILNNKPLQQRIRAGSQDAATRQGRFVDLSGVIR